MSIFVLNCVLYYSVIDPRFGPIKNSYMHCYWTYTLVLCEQRGIPRRDALDSAHSLCVLYITYMCTQCRITIVTIWFRRLLVPVLCMWAQVWYNISMFDINLQMYELLWTPRYCLVSSTSELNHDFQRNKIIASVYMCVCVCVCVCTCICEYKIDMIMTVCANMLMRKDK